MTESWQVDEKEMQSESIANFISSEGWYRAYVKWDGCIEFYRAFNVPFTLQEADHVLVEDEDQIHICDIDETIELLQGLKKVAIEKFGEWPG